MSTMPEFRGALLAMQGETVLAEVAAAGHSARTRFQIASVSKQFTAVAVLLLAQRGLLGLDDPIDRWVDDRPPSWDGITLHHLLTHTSGLGHWGEYPMIDLFQPVPPGELLAAFRQVEPLFAPGGGWHYSSPGYVLLAHAVARAADRPYRDVLTQDIFEPLGMADTFVGSPGDRPDIARGHGADGEPLPSYELDVVAMGAGDLWSTTGDLLRWLDGLRTGQLLDARHRELMLTEHAATGHEPDSRGYGYGCFVGLFGDEAWFHHSGGNSGFRSFAACLPASNRRIVVLSDSEATNMAVLDELLTATLT
ncbi:serine hydrolase domain-containing protein [Catellatospora sp. KI3]|uniref:serine hydrolase domain-containing protein n=1 Tax=Catellatospora sp. KI3 TaxID=3041620 RepID=UPI002482F52D|nr:serine hydrolase domain-containing protein [Catellatospora sp. KI3]MDI1461279.1 serine hydrolase domain-containing protein [Catellatospora sp. KI3]